MRRAFALVLVAAFAPLAGCVAPDGVPGRARSDEARSNDLGLELGWADGIGSVVGGGPHVGRDVAVTPTGDVAFTVEFETEVNVAGTPYPGVKARDILVATYQADGKTSPWGKVIGDAAEDLRPLVAVDRDGNLAVAGSFQGTITLGGDPITSAGSLDVFVGKLDKEGKPLWLHGFGDNRTQHPCDVAVDSQGNVIVVGFVDGTMDFGSDPPFPMAPDYAIFIVKLDRDGKHVWSRRIGRTGSGNWDDPTATVAVTDTDEIVIAGFAEGALSIPKLKDIPLVGKKSAFVAKLDADGNGVWGKSFGAPDKEQRVYGLAVGPQGEVAITGAMYGAVNFGGEDLVSVERFDAYVAVFSASGDHIWSRRFGSLGDQIGTAAAFDASGDLFVAGNFAGVLDLYGEDAVVNAGAGITNSDVFLTRFDPAGMPLGCRAYGDTDVQFATAMALDRATGNLWMTGSFLSKIDFDGELLTSTGNFDAFLVKLSPKK